MEEIWKVIPGYGGLYEVSDHGNVRSIPRIAERGGSYYTVKGQVLNQGTHKHGYKTVHLTPPGGKQELRTVHRLVLTTFVGAPAPGQVTRHLNNVRDDNRLSNLSWGTVKENTADRVAAGNTTKGLTKDFCVRGHPRVEGNLTGTSDSSARSCLSCSRAGSLLRQRKARRGTEFTEEDLLKLSDVYLKELNLERTPQPL